LVIGDIRFDPRAVVCSRRCVDAQDESSVQEPQAQLRREAVQDVEQAGLVQDTAGPADPPCHGCIAFYQIDAPGRVGGGRVRCGLLTGQDIAVRVAAQHADTRQSSQKLKHLDRPRTEQDKVTERPPAVYSEAVRIL
jgi:hypothetical protein